jgi:hypothetical protein
MRMKSSLVVIGNQIKPPAGELVPAPRVEIQAITRDESAANVQRWLESRPARLAGKFSVR